MRGCARCTASTVRFWVLDLGIDAAQLGTEASAVDRSAVLLTCMEQRPLRGLNRGQEKAGATDEFCGFAASIKTRIKLGFVISGVGIGELE